MKKVNHGALRRGGRLATSGGGNGRKDKGVGRGSGNGPDDESVGRIGLGGAGKGIGGSGVVGNTRAAADEGVSFAGAGADADVAVAGAVRGKASSRVARGGQQRAKSARAMRENVASKEQLVLRFRTWGGARAGAGRPRGTGRVAHTTRPRVSRHVPMHVTLRVVAGLPNLRGKRAFRVVRQALGLERAGDARVVQYSVLSNHVHLIVEAVDARELGRGMQALGVRLARRLNRLFGRRGRVFADRFHLRPLRTPLEVRRALAYVLNNFRRHADERGPALPLTFLDPCSSAAWFDGWHVDWIHARPDPRAFRDPWPDLPPGVVRARSVLLMRLWRRHGLMRPFI
jgi:hypothetical protein